MTIIAIGANVSRETSGDDVLGAWLAEAGRGQAGACFDLGVAFSTGSNGAACDLIEAHKWFNLAAMSGDERAQLDRSEVAASMTPAEVAAAQREARAFLMQTRH